MKKIVLIFALFTILVSSTACNNTNSKNIDVKDNSSDKAVTENNSSKQNVKLEFSTTDIKGKAISNEDVKDSKLIMVNFWEPWCGPCVNEMPELEKIYKKYKDKGFIILGVFYSSDNLDDAKSIIKDKKVTYPILIGNNDFKEFTTEYVPTTVFFDSDGKQLSSEAVVGAREYDEWEKEILKYLND